MRKAAVRDGDPTTTRGSVIAHTSTIYDNRKKVALDGDEATCGNCSGSFKIIGTGKGISEKSRNVVIDGDVVLCPCGRNRVIVGDNPGIFLRSSRSQANIASTVTPMEANPPRAEAESFNERFVLCDADGAVMPLTAYALQFENGSLVYGTTDRLGRTHQIESGKQAEQVKLYVAG